jgi:hypothetical protein
MGRRVRALRTSRWLFAALCLLAILSRALSKGMLPHKPSTPAARFLGLWEGRDGMPMAPDTRRIHKDNEQNDRLGLVGVAYDSRRYSTNNEGASRKRLH